MKRPWICGFSNPYTKFRSANLIGHKFYNEMVLLSLNFHNLMSLVLCVVTTFFIPTARHVIEGREFLGMASIFMSVSSGNLFPFLLWMEPGWLWYVDNNLSSAIQLETILPSFWFRNLKIPSIPPTANVDLSFRMCCKEDTTLGLTRVFHNSFRVLHDVKKQDFDMSDEIYKTLHWSSKNEWFVFCVNQVSSTRNYNRG